MILAWLVYLLVWLSMRAGECHEMTIPLILSEDSGGSNVCDMQTDHSTDRLDRGQHDAQLRAHVCAMLESLTSTTVDSMSADRRCWLFETAMLLEHQNNQPKSLNCCFNVRWRALKEVDLEARESNLHEQQGLLTNESSVVQKTVQMLVASFKKRRNDQCQLWKQMCKHMNTPHLFLPSALRRKYRLTADELDGLAMYNILNHLAFLAQVSAMHVYLWYITETFLSDNRTWINVPLAGLIILVAVSSLRFILHLALQRRFAH